MRSISTLMILSLLIVAFMAMSVFGASAPTPSKRVASTLADKMIQYSFPDESNYSPTSSGQKPAEQSLGLANPPEGSLSPGAKIGDTWYDYQHNGTMGRMVDWGYDATNGYIVHFAWMRMNQSAYTARHFAYNTYKATTNAIGEALTLQGSEEYAGYVGLASMANGGGAIVGGHNNPGGGYAPHFYYETGDPGEGTFDISYVSDPPLCDGIPVTSDCPIWPKFRYQEVPGQAPVTHVFAQESNGVAGAPQSISYFRKVGIGATGSWDASAYLVDTVSDISQDVACSNTNGKVALVWSANGCPDLSACDTCSDNSDSYAVVNGQWENDVYYQISGDYGVSWGPRVNMTKHHHEDDFWLCYTDLTCLIDSDNNLHVGFSATRWGMEEGTWTALGYNDECRLLHWSETIGTQTTSHADGLERANMQIVASLVYDEQTAIDKQCISGAWNVAGSKMSVSECNGRLYYLWVQFQDPANGVYDDCAQRAWEGTTSGSANGELMLAVSTGLQGCLWDGARNLTNSYTPHCDSVTGENGRCDSDNWPSMARFGSNHATPLLDDSVIVDPSGSYTDGWYLPVQYISDRDAGGIVQDEGTWKMADVAWFQLACVPPVPTRTVTTSFARVGFPAWTNDAQGGTVCTTLTLQNIGNQDATGITTATNVTSGHPQGALTADHGTFSLTAGCEAGVHEGDICMGNGLISSAGAPQELIGTVTFDGTFDNAPVVIPINFFVADTVFMQVWDTIYCDDGSKAAALALTVGNNGNYGNAGERRVNLDYFVYGDCAWWDDENETNPYRGDARVYLYDGSPIICYDDGGTIKCTYSMFDVDFATMVGDAQGFFPQADPPQAYPAWMTPNLPVDADLHVAQFVNRDTTILVEQVSIAPNVENPTYMIQAVKYTNLTGSDITGLAIGEGIDWDVPSDTGSQNQDGYDGARHLMYQVGEEYGQDELECTRNDMRAAGLAVIEMYDNSTDSSVIPERGLYCMDNATQVYPEGHFPPDSLWAFMGNKTGFTRADSSQYNDLHMVGTYRWDHTLPANGGYFIVYTIKTTTYNGGAGALSNSVDVAIAWYNLNFKAQESPSCCRYVGDINHDAAMDGVPLIDDLVYLVTFMFQNDLLCTSMCDDDPTPGCNNGDVAILPETDINGDGTTIPDIADLVYLVNYMFQGQPQPPAWDDYYTPACNPGPFK